MNKTDNLYIRLSAKDKELIERTAAKYNLSVTKFVLAVLIPYCCKIDNKRGDT